MHRYQVHVRVIERVEGSDIAPVGVITLGGPGDQVGVEVVDCRAAVGHQPGNDVTAHVVVGMVVIGIRADHVDEFLGGEDVVPHRDEGRIGIVRSTGRIRRLLHELANAPSVVGIDASERTRLGAGHPDARDGHRCSTFYVKVQHLLGVHPVHVVGTEHHDVLGILVEDQIERLMDGIGATGVPARAESLLSGHRGDVLPRQTRQTPVLRDVPVQ
ncbi:Uncharacterised protein [Mycobacteroides abscessus subsp. abscessus]|nr:Uncharacterised protein [Mycobacteroides abscessus subsp. abscessus]